MTNAIVDTSAGIGGGMDSFAALFEQSVEGGDFAREGEIISGTVVQVGRDAVVVDIGGKSEGVISSASSLTHPARRRSSPATRSTFTSRAARTTTAS